MITAKKAWKNGELIDWEDATVHVMTHALHYGTAFFEGIRCYKTERGSEIFRLQDHILRLYNSCRIYRIEIPYEEEELQAACVETIQANGLDECYIRPLVFRGVGAIGVNPLNNPVEYFVLVWKWGKYLGDEAIEQGVDVCVSSWNRAAPNTFPPLAKAAGNYLNGGLIKMEAVTNGFAEGIALDSHGYVSEGSGENLFVLARGRLFTSPLAQAILPGITRDTVITLAGEAGYEVSEQAIPREMLYTADEIFMTGTAAEITPIRSVDRVPVGTGRRGPVTTDLQERFFDYVEGRVEDRHNWMTPVPTAATASARSAAD